MKNGDKNKKYISIPNLFKINMVLSLNGTVVLRLILRTNVAKYPDKIQLLNQRH